MNWDIGLQLTLPQSDYFDLDDPQFYGRFKEPLYDALYGSKVNTASKEDPDWWLVKPPPIRTFNDQAMWERLRKLHGFEDGYVMSPPYRAKR